MLRGNPYRYARYTLRGRPGPLDLTLAVDVQDLQGRNMKFGKVNLVDVVHGTDRKPRRVCVVCKNRFAIESSYGSRNVVRAPTSSRNIVLRYLLTIISFLLKNIRVALQWICFSHVQRGPRAVDDDLFRFDLFRLLVGEGKHGARGILSLDRR